MDDDVARFFTRFGGNLFIFLTCGRRSLVSTFSIMPSAASAGRSLQYHDKPFKNEVKFGLSAPCSEN